jgi:hypothetical protein
MANNFTKQEQVMFDDMVAGFDDSLIIGKLATKYDPLSPSEMELARDQFWIPAPLIGSTFNGFDQTSNFGDLTNTQVQVSIGYHKSDPRKLSAKNLRNKNVLNQWGKAARQKLASTSTSRCSRPSPCREASPSSGPSLRPATTTSALPTRR